MTIMPLIAATKVKLFRDEKQFDPGGEFPHDQNESLKRWAIEQSKDFIRVICYKFKVFRAETAVL